MSLAPALRQTLEQQSLSFGGAPLGNLFRRVTDAEAIGLVRHAYARGVRWFDTAPHYGHGLSELRIGNALRDLPRGSYRLSTKVGRRLRPEQDVPEVQHGYVGGLPYVQVFDYTRDGIRRALDDSAKRLGTDYFDIVYVHDLDEATHGPAFARHFEALLDGGLPALAELKAAGRIGGYGIGVNAVAICLRTMRHADLDVILLAGRYTLADTSALAEVLPMCLRREVAVVLGGPFNSGILATGAHPGDGAAPYFDYAPASAERIAHVAAIEDVLRRHAVPLRAAALQFPRAHPAIASVLAGARARTEFDDNLAMLRFPIPQGCWLDLRAQGLLPREAPLPGASVP